MRQDTGNPEPPGGEIPTESLVMARKRLLGGASSVKARCDLGGSMAIGTEDSASLSPLVSGNVDLGPEHLQPWGGLLCGLLTLALVV